LINAAVKYSQVVLMMYPGTNIILIGDFFQLPFVGSEPLLGDSNGSVDEVQGQFFAAYQVYL
jgi:hypothetical protein